MRAVPGSPGHACCSCSAGSRSRCAACTPAAGIGFLHDLVELAGGEDVFGDIKRESVQATAELVLARRPDVILEIRADPVEPAVVTQEVAAWNALASVPAVRNHRVTFLTGSELVTPGPRIAAAAERIFTAIQH